MSSSDLSKPTDLRGSLIPQGPWEYRPHKYDDWGLVRSADGWPVATASMAALPDHTDLGAFRRAGADPLERTGRLIAAAPEMLEALKSLRVNGEYAHSANETMRRVAIMDAAIAKAEGE